MHRRWNNIKYRNLCKVVTRVMTLILFKVINVLQFSTRYTRNRQTERSLQIMMMCWIFFFWKCFFICLIIFRICPALKQHLIGRYIVVQLHKPLSYLCTTWRWCRTWLSSSIVSFICFLIRSFSDTPSWYLVSIITEEFCRKSFQRLFVSVDFICKW